MNGAPTTPKAPEPYKLKLPNKIPNAFKGLGFGRPRIAEQSTALNALHVLGFREKGLPPPALPASRGPCLAASAA